METSPPLDARRITAALAGQSLGCEVQVHEEVASTNDLARELGAAGFPHGLVILAEAQSAGRGRRENRWLAGSGRDILMSILLRPPVPTERWPRTTTLAALAISHAIEAAGDYHPRIKWPNDVYLRDRKVAGILGETFSSDQGLFMVLGIGLNVNTCDFPRELQDSATSLLLERSAPSMPLNRNTLIISLLRAFESALACIDDGFEKIVNAVRQRSWLLGKRIEARLPDGPFAGVAIGLNAEGYLIVRDERTGAERVLSSAEQVRVT